MNDMDKLLIALDNANKALKIANQQLEEGLEALESKLPVESKVELKVIKGDKE